MAQTPRYPKPAAAGPPLTRTDQPIVDPSMLLKTEPPNIRPPTISPLDDDLFIIYQWAIWRWEERDRRGRMVAKGYQVPISYLYFDNPQNLPVSQFTRQNVRRLEDVFYEKLKRSGGSLKAVRNQLGLDVDDTVAFFLKIVKERKDASGQPAIKFGPAGRLNFINDYLRLDEKKGKYPTEESLDDRYDAWLDRYNQDVNRISRVVKKVLEQRNRIMHKELGGPLTYTLFEKNMIVVSGIPHWSNRYFPMVEASKNGQLIGLSEILRFFDLSRVSFDVPFIQYNMGLLVDPRLHDYEVDRIVAKLYNSDIDTADLNYENIVPDASKMESPNTMYFTIWLGEGAKSRAPKDSYMPASYDAFKKKIQLTISVKKPKDEEVIKNKLLRAVPFEVPKWEESKVNGQFKILDVEIDRISLLHAVLTDKSMNDYFYVDESDTPSGLKVTLYLHLRSPLVVIGETKQPGFEQKIKYLSKFVSINGLKERIKVSYIQRYSEPDETFNVVKDGLSEEMTLPPNTPYVIISVYNAPSQAEVNRLIAILTHILNYYKRFKGRYLDFYINQQVGWVPELASVVPLKVENQPLLPRVITAVTTAVPTTVSEEEMITPATLPTVTRESRNNLLRRLAPDIFMANFASIVQTEERQPIPIRKEDIEIWRNKTFIDRKTGNVTLRQVMEFPPHTDRLFFVCPNDDFPYPGVKNNNLPNKDKYPYIPHCYVTNHMAEGRETNYNVYYRGQQKMKKKASQHTVNPDKIANFDAIGNIDRNIKKLLTLNDKPGYEYERIGVPRDNNSLIHSVLLGRANLDYVTMESGLSRSGQDYVNEKIKKRKEIAADYRQRIVNKTNPIILMQENYDITADQIMSNLANNDIFFDPALFYRAIEEYFQISLFVFVSKAEMPSSSEKGYKQYSHQLEIPKHKKYYTRRTRLDRPMLLIFKFVKTKERGVDIPAQCELIARKIPGKTTVYSSYAPGSNNKMIAGLYNLFYEMSSVIQWSIKPLSCNDTICIKEQLIVGKVLNNGDFSDIIDKVRPEIGTSNTRARQDTTPIKQLVDDYGKCIGLYYIVQPSVGQLRGRKFNIFAAFLPVQPYDLPLIMGWDEVLTTLPTYQEVRLLLGDPIAVTHSFQFVTSSNLAETSSVKGRKIVNGLWYSAYERTHAVYIPINDTSLSADNLATIKVGRKAPINLLRSTKISHIERLTRLEKIHITILSIVEWVFKLSNLTAEQFIADYFLIGGGQVDSLQIYNVNALNINYPIVSGPDEAIEYITANTNGIIVNGKIFLYNRKYYEGVSFYVKDMYKNQERLPVFLPKTIPNSYTLLTDFYQRLNTLIFLSQSDLNAWLRNKLTILDSSIVMRTSLGNFLSTYTNPYLLDNKIKNQIFLIQNVSEITITNITDETLMTQYNIIVRNNQTYAVPTSALTTTGISMMPGFTSFVAGTMTEEELVRAEEEQLAREEKARRKLVSLAAALNLVYTWRTKRINLGHDSSPFIGKFPPYIIYRVVEGQLPVIKEDKSGANRNPFRILIYDNSTYAAMLRIA